MMSAYTRYTKFALDYIANGKPNRHLNNSEQQTIIIYTLLNDGNWHTAKEISQKLNLKKSTVRHIMQALADSFDIASGQQGYCIPQKHTILIA